VGTGPYRFVELVKDDRMIVEAYDRHWRGAPKIHQTVFRPVPEPFTRAAALRNNEQDLITNVPPVLARDLERASGVKVHRVPSTCAIYLGLNAFKKPLSDVRVRQALNYATDVDAIIKNVLEGNGRRLAGPFTPNMFGFDASVKEIAESLAGQWQKAGFKPKAQVAEWGASFKKHLSKQFGDAYLLGMGGPMQDGDELYNLVSSKGRSLYCKNERMDQLFDAGRSTMDPARRKRIYTDLAKAMVEDGTWVFLMPQVDLYATRDRVEWTPRPDLWLLFQGASLK
jgi:peptide/nickel transport system substrate-binding protein